MRIGRISCMVLFSVLFVASAVKMETRAATFEVGSITLRVSAALPPTPQAGGPVAPPKTGTPHQNTLTWTASVSAVAGYNIYRANVSGGQTGTVALNGSTLVSGTSFVDTAVTSGQAWFYVVVAQSSTGNQSAWSNEASGVTPTNPAPASGMGCNSN